VNHYDSNYAANLEQDDPEWRGPTVDERETREAELNTVVVFWEVESPFGEHEHTIFKSEDEAVDFVTDNIGDYLASNGSVQVSIVRTELPFRDVLDFDWASEPSLDQFETAEKKGTNS
jgi:hypothetical protein